MAANEILTFAGTDTGTNLLTQAEYNADSQRLIGNQPGIARSKLVNKALRQSTLISAAVAQYIANKQSVAVTDMKTVSELEAMLINSIAAQINSSLPDGVPAGSVFYFARPTPPSGYIKANGAVVSRTTYANLFAAIGTTFGSGDGSTTFALPDLRAEFIRGLDDGRGIDPARAFGSWQEDMFKSHYHETDLEGPKLDGPTRYAGVMGYLNHPTTNTFNTGGAETRPRNIALLACIKY